MHPYRTPPPEEEPPRAPGEELVMYAMLVGFGSIPIAAAAIQGRAFGVDATIGMVLVGAGLAGAVRRLARAGKR